MLAKPEGKEEEPLVAAFAAQGLVTHEVLHDRGYDLSPSCPLCKSARDGLLHRALYCQHTQVVEQRNAALTLQRQQRHQLDLASEDKETAMRARLLWEKRYGDDSAEEGGQRTHGTIHCYKVGRGGATAGGQQS